MDSRNQIGGMIVIKIEDPREKLTPTQVRLIGSAQVIQKISGARRISIPIDIAKNNWKTGSIVKRPNADKINILRTVVIETHRFDIKTAHRPCKNGRQTHIGRRKIGITGKIGKIVPRISCKGNSGKGRKRKKQTDNYHYNSHGGVITEEFPMRNERLTGAEEIGETFGS